MVANLRHNFVLWASMPWGDTSLLVWHIMEVSCRLSFIMKALGPLSSPFLLHLLRYDLTNT